MAALPQAHGMASHPIFGCVFPLRDARRFERCFMRGKPRAQVWPRCCTTPACARLPPPASAGACVAASGFVVRLGRRSFENKTGASPAVASTLRVGHGAPGGPWP
ncbi:hypothetical protein Veis_2588 [Verminephrobacter eiseniae EF01-2]|uniref:Uncharacterized protein n=1 Tax=Verminephrobacter eiseniae (strain EF01-2) TaxID=391735 RepID=A1WL26_VEREI|nr:hypothetical protein Veis_2588 [Verminephrobacter eiseniae EF01-2]